VEALMNPNCLWQIKFPLLRQFLGKRGFNKETDWVEYNLKVPDATPEKYLTMASLWRSGFNLRCAPVSAKRISLPMQRHIPLAQQSLYESARILELSPRQLEDLKNHFLPMLQ
jgi:hypothetical protein